jgi:enoyl-CoA hydratase/carnithine racemase
MTDPNPNLLRVDFLAAHNCDGQIAHVQITRPAKRNALNDALISELQRTFQTMPKDCKAAVVSGEGEHFCAGLDLSELQERDAAQGMHHSRTWHAALDAIAFGPVPVVCAIQGACVGGGLELASAAHLRVTDTSGFFALPEGSRGIFVGGGGSVRISRLIGVARMTDMMLTGRVVQAEDAMALNLAQYLVRKGDALTKALELAQRIASNAPMTNYAITHVLPRIADQSADHGLMTEALVSAIAQSAPEAKARVKAFLDGGANKVQSAKP